MFAWLFPWRKKKAKFQPAKPTAVEPRVKASEIVPPTAPQPAKFDDLMAQMNQHDNTTPPGPPPQVPTGFTSPGLIGVTGMAGPNGATGMTGRTQPHRIFTARDEERRRDLFERRRPVNNRDLVDDLVTTAEFIALMKLVGGSGERSESMHITPPDWNKDVPWEGGGGKFSGGGASGSWDGVPEHTEKDVPPEAHDATADGYTDPTAHLFENVNSVEVAAPAPDYHEYVAQDASPSDDSTSEDSSDDTTSDDDDSSDDSDDSDDSSDDDDSSDSDDSSDDSSSDDSSSDDSSSSSDDSSSSDSGGGGSDE